MHWKSHRSPRRKKKAQKSKSDFKAMMIIFLFDIRTTVHIDWVPEGQIFNQVYYKEFLTTFREQVRRNT
jgi:hypothetical protein